jgi:hypothetical protein
MTGWRFKEENKREGKKHGGKMTGRKDHGGRI